MTIQTKQFSGVKTEFDPHGLGKLDRLGSVPNMTGDLIRDRCLGEEHEFGNREFHRIIRIWLFQSYDNLSVK